MTATVLGEKNTSNGCLRLRLSFFLAGLMIACIFGICLWAERGLVEGLYNVQRVESVLARNRLDIAVIAGCAKAKMLKYGKSFRMTLLHITDDHVTADQLIESKHSFCALEWQLSSAP
jgi:hypothetical protein